MACACHSSCSTETPANAAPPIDPRWQGDVPAGTVSIAAPGDDVWIIGRMLVDNGYSTAWFGKDHNVPAFQASQAGPGCPGRSSGHGGTGVRGLGPADGLARVAIARRFALTAGPRACQPDRVELLIGMSLPRLTRQLACATACAPTATARPRWC